MGSLPDSDGGSAAHQPASRGDPRRRHAAAEVHGLHPVLPQRSRLLRRRRPRPDPAAPVRQGGAGQVHPARAVVRRARIAHRERREDPAGARPGLSHRAAVHRRHGLRVGQDLRHRSVAAQPGALSRDLVVQQLRGVPGAPRRDPRPRRGPEEVGSRAHAERLGPGGRPHADRDPRELPAGRRLGRDPRGAASLHGRPHPHRASRARGAERRRDRQGPFEAPAAAGGAPRCWISMLVAS